MRFPSMAGPSRIPEFSYRGAWRYFLTICTRARLPHFGVADHALLAADQFLYTGREQAVAIVTYCVMPDHVHLLVGGQGDDSDLREFVRLSKQRSGYRFKQQAHTRLWQPGYYEHVLRHEERTEEVVSYIINNPVRKRIVDRPEAYQFWGSSLYTREELLRSIGIRRT